jgi:hypothetical protein
VAVLVVGPDGEEMMMARVADAVPELHYSREDMAGTSFRRVLVVCLAVLVAHHCFQTGRGMYIHDMGC